MCLISGTVRSTPLPWLPVLTNIEPPALRRRAATDKLITQAECHRDWPLYDDVFHPPPLRLESRKPLWKYLQTIDVTSRWREDWQLATVVNSTLVVDPTIWLPGFDLHRRLWSLLNRFRTGQGHCNACHKKWGFTDNELWRNPDSVTHRQLLPIDQIWRQSTALTWSRWGCRRLADNIWLLAHNNNNSAHVMRVAVRFRSSFQSAVWLSATDR